MDCDLPGTPGLDKGFGVTAGDVRTDRPVQVFKIIKPQLPGACHCAFHGASHINPFIITAVLAGRQFRSGSGWGDKDDTRELSSLFRGSFRFLCLELVGNIECDPGLGNVSIEIHDVRGILQ